MRPFNKDRALRKIKIKQNKNPYIKRISIVLSCIILIIGIMLFTFAKFESTYEYTLINGQISSYSSANLQITRNEIEIHSKRVNISNGTATYDYDLSGQNITNATNISCNNNAYATIENNIFKISNITTDTICKINDNINFTINNLDNTNNNIKIIKNENTTNVLTLTSKQVDLDLNGKTITYTNGNNQNMFNNNGTSNINIHDGTLTANNLVGYAICDNRGTLTFNNVTINGDSNNRLFWVRDNGVLDIKNSTITASNSGIISTHNGGSNLATNANVIIENSTLNSVNEAIDNYHNGTITIKSGTFNGTNIVVRNLNAGSVKIFNGNFQSSSNSVVYNVSSGTVDIEGGIYIGTTSNANSIINNAGTGTINISDKTSRVYIGNFNSGSSSSNPKAILNKNSGLINISGHKANNCTDNKNNTTSGICLYSYYRTLVNEDVSTGTVKVDGASIVSNSHCALCHFAKNTYVKNVDIKSVNDTAVYAAYNTNVLNPSSASLKICNAEIVTYNNNKDVVIHSGYTGSASYYNVKFRNGSTTPNSTYITDTNNKLVSSSSACNW